MKKTNSMVVVLVVAMLLVSGGCQKCEECQKPAAEVKPAQPEQQAAADKAKSDEQIEQKASKWMASLNLGDAEKEARVKDVIVTHLKAVRDWHNEHPITSVPEGINPLSGKPLSKLDRQVIADSAMPRSVHENLMAGLAKDLSPEQVEAVLDKYTVGKVAFTLKGYYAIVPDLTDAEAATILTNLKEARERAVDFKNMEEISAIFEIYKTKCEQYLNSQGRDWKALFKAYVDAAKAKKKAAASK
jgi:uncharacterized protein YdbL (DUF1318 family)